MQIQSRLIWCTLAAVLAASVAGCSPGDVQLNGKIFDALGVNGNSSSSKVPKMRERTGLIIPPDTGSLPAPGTGETAEPSLAEIKDPDQMKKVSQIDLERQQAAYCKEHYELAKMRGDLSADAAKGPLGLCRPSAISALEKWNKSDKAQDGAQ
jgi:hypothetical protein